MPSPRYRLNLVNASPMGGAMGVFLRAPDAEMGRGGLQSLVWRALDCGPGRSVQLEWSEDFSLTWAEGLFSPGQVFSGGELTPARPDEPAGASFTLGRRGQGFGLRPAAPATGPEGDEYVPEDIGAAFVLSLKPGETRRGLADLVRDRPPPPPAAPGLFQVLVEPLAPFGAVTTALCLAGRPSLLRPAEPGRTLVFPARPRYGVVFGSFETGQVLDPDQVVLTTEIDFPAAGGAARAVFRRDGGWDAGAED